MRNLRLYNLKKAELEALENANKICTDAESGQVFICAGNKIASMNSTCEVNLSTVARIEASDAEIVSCTYLPEFQGVCVATKIGDVLLFNIDSEEADMLGSVSGGILAMQWSPDHEVVAIISGEENLLLMTKEFDPVSERSIHPEEFGERAPVTAGWGSKATQFHGSEGKQAAKVEIKAPGPASEWDDGLPRISWRGDGQYFVTSCIDRVGGHRKLRVWNRQGNLQFTGEGVDGLEQALSWKPSGSLIASSQRLPNKHQVVFFEKNGLRHGEFTLPFGPKDFEAKELSWSNDSAALAVIGCTLNASDDSLQKDIILIYTVNNYHWYLKQTLKFDPSTHGRVVACLWDDDEALCLHVLCMKGRYFRYAWRWVTDGSVQSYHESCAVVSVIDGDDVLSTPFKTMVVPPPMCSYKLHCYTQVNHLAFSSGSNCNDSFAVLEDGSIVFVLANAGEFVKTEENKKCEVQVEGATNGFRLSAAIPEVFGPYRIAWGDIEERIPCNPLSLYHWTWVSQNCLLAVGHIDDIVTLLRVDVIHSGHETLLRGSVLTYLDDTVRTLSLGEDRTFACIQFANGTCGRVSFEDGSVLLWLAGDELLLQFPRPCHSVVVCKVLGGTHLLGLSDRFQLFVDDYVVCENCTSFLVHGKFLLLTTHTHTLRCLLLDFDIAQVLEGRNLHAAEDAPRQLERGSLLVTSVVADGRVVLQMPRGNLETIYPRPLMLDAICEYLDSFQYGKAFELMKVHRINLNFLCDHDTQAFLSNLKEFVLQVRKPANINLFLTELSNDDVCSMMYTAAYRSRSRKILKYDRPKTDVVCDSICKILEELDRDKYFLSILTCHAKKVEPELDIALLKIKALKDATGTSKVTADDALKYLLYLVDTSDLFNVALGTYNFDLVLMVAEKSQKDPKEYVPFLNELNQLETNYQHYKIDMHLGRYEKALKNISICGPSHFDECISLIKSQRLYTKALHLFQEGSDEYKAVWEAYGDYLFQKKHFEESGIVFQRSGKLEKALTSFELALNWSLVLTIACQLGYEDDKLRGVAKRVADALMLSRRHREAALIYEEFLNDREEVIRILAEAHLWDEALSKIHSYKKSELLDRVWKPAVKNEHVNMTETIDTLFETWQKHCNRLTVVRELKMSCDQGPEDDTDDGAYSDVASLSSRPATERSIKSATVLTGSIATMRTARNKKKQERKKYTLKEGSRFEDLALVVALAEAVSSADKLQEDCGSLLKALAIAGYDSEAKDLQQKFSALLASIGKNIPEVWPPESAAETSLPLGPHSSSSIIVEAIQKRDVFEHAISDPSLRKPPALRTFINWKLNMLE
ncbi:putative elongator complex protein 1 [Ornithodoros turicata]|uniref:putative elongator complex protein 1 n=1 Tax=Ornithodoros turicata TaxID=34597 RepID=UPI0031398C5F